MTFLEQILLTIVTASVTAVLAYFGFWRQAKAELQKEYESRYNERKWEVYLRFVEQIKNLHTLSIFPPSYPGEDDELNREMKELDKSVENTIQEVRSEIFLIGSKEVVELFGKWYSLYNENAFGEENTFKTMIDLVNVMRTDLGRKEAEINYKTFEGAMYYSRERMEALMSKTRVI